MDLKPAPGAANWLTTDLSALFDSAESKAGQAGQAGPEEAMTSGRTSRDGVRVGGTSTASLEGDGAQGGTASELLESLAAAAYEAGLGLGLGTAPAPAAPAGSQPAGDGDGADAASGRDYSTSLVGKGRLMNELCERFYRRYPYEGGKWPDKPAHRCLIDFLEDEKHHTPGGVEHFCAVMRLPPPGPPV